MKSPAGSTFKDDKTAIEQLEYWTDHNPSITIYVREYEWLEVGAWVYKNFDLVTGISFLPSNGGVYELAPYEEITEEEYEELIKKLPVIDFSLLSLYEQQDQTQGSREYACGGGTCEL